MGGRACLSIMAGAVIGSAAMAGAPQKIVEVDGKSYRVVLKQGGAFVYSRAMIGTPTPKDMERRRRAVTAATGCRLRDDILIGGALTGMLDCPAGEDTQSINSNR